MDVLFGDGTAVDLLFQDRDGRQVKLWAILWLDDCTGRLVGHFLPRPRGEGARMEHVALSFALVCAEIGFPKVVYVHNGSKSGWVVLLKRSAERRSGKESVRTYRFRGWPNH